MSTALETETYAETYTYRQQRWATVVWNDPINLMNYVQAVFREYFGFSDAKAQRLMLQVHQVGRATVSQGERARMEADVLAMHSYGLRATLEPLGFSSDQSEDATQNQDSNGAGE